MSGGEKYPGWECPIFEQTFQVSEMKNEWEPSLIDLMVATKGIPEQMDAAISAQYIY